MSRLIALVHLAPTGQFPLPSVPQKKSVKVNGREKHGLLGLSHSACLPLQSCISDGDTSDAWGR